MEEGNHQERDASGIREDPARDPIQLIRLVRRQRPVRELSYAVATKRPEFHRRPGHIALEAAAPRGPPRAGPAQGPGVEERERGSGPVPQRAPPPDPRL